MCVWVCEWVSLFPPCILGLLSLSPGHLRSQLLPPSTQEIKVSLNLPDRPSLSSPWTKVVADLPRQRDTTLKCFCLPSLEKHPLPSLPEISSLFRWCLRVWQLFSLAWCSILLEGGRRFRRFTVTLTDPNHLLPLLPFFFLSWHPQDCTLHISTYDVNIQPTRHTCGVKLTFRQGCV